jgi:glycosyltransferase involved in cell wall biosynthesis
MIASFGERARQWAAGAKVDGDVIAADETAYLDAILEAMRKRLRGEPFAVALFLEEDPNRFVRAWGAQLLESAQDIDRRRAVCASIVMGAVVVDGRRQVELGGITGDTLGLGRLLWHLGDAAVVVSEASYSRLATVFGKWHASRVFPLQRDPEVPRPKGPADEREHLVIWAGARSADDIAVIACALEELHVPVYAVCEEGLLPETIHRCSVAQSEPLLRSAVAILDATGNHPAAALALAEFGAPLAIARTSGAQEFLDGAIGYDGWNRDSVLDAALRALGAAPPIPIVIPSVGARSAPKSRDSGNAATVRDRAPLVSIVIPTRNRRAYLPRALESIANQDYPAIETVIVNDAESVRDIAEQLGAVLIELDTPVDHAAAWNAGIERARGEYIAFLDDDDFFFPDHVSTLVDTATRAGTAAVHASSVIAHRGDEPDAFVGFSPGCLVGIDLEETLVNCPTIGMIGSMVRRDVFAELGLFNSDVTPNDDYEMILRIALHHDWIHADRVTYVYTREGGYDHSSVKTATYADLYERSYKLHPFPDRPVLAARRRQFIEQVRSSGIMLNVVSARLASPTSLASDSARQHTAPRGRRSVGSKGK